MPGGGTACVNWRGIAWPGHSMGAAWCVCVCELALQETLSIATGTGLYEAQY